MEKRYFIQVGNCFVEFLGIFHETKMRADHKKATSFLSYEAAHKEAVLHCWKSGIKDFKIVSKDIVPSAEELCCEM